LLAGYSSRQGKPPTPLAAGPAYIQAALAFSPCYASACASMMSSVTFLLNCSCVTSTDGLISVFATTTSLSTSYPLQQHPPEERMAHGIRRPEVEANAAEFEDNFFYCLSLCFKQFYVSCPTMKFFYAGCFIWSQLISFLLLVNFYIHNPGMWHLFIGSRFD
jgi:hypothetical protein